MSVGLGTVLAVPPVMGAIVVSSAGSTLKLSLVQDASPLNPLNKALVEHFVDSSRAGIRVRALGLGDAPIVSSSESANCVNNVVFNDVVCTGAFTRIEISSSNDADRRNTIAIGGSNVACNVANPIEVSAVLGPAPDDLLSNPTCGLTASSVLTLTPRFIARGGSGIDRLFGGPLDDDLDGGSNAGDRVDGGGGADTLRGATTIFAGPGNDTMFATTVTAADPGNEYNGGPGTDTLRFDGETRALTIRLDGVRNDGFDGKTNILETEKVIGGPQNDTMVALGGSQTLDGTGGDDNIEGGGGADVLNGGSGDDFIDARDGAADTINCGSGNDAVVVDLIDPVKEPQTGRGATVVSALDSSFCERIERFAIDDGPPGRVTNRQIAVADGARAATLRLACPRAARVACRGRLTLRLGRARVGSAVYQVARGATTQVAVPLTVSGVAALRRAGVVRAGIREQGASRKGPRTSSTVLRVVQR